MVDDDAALLDLLTSLVRSLGYLAFPATSAEHALEVIARQPVDVALCDINLPGHDGLWLARQIRDDHPHTAIIMATGGRDIAPAVDSLRNDVVDYLLKPFDTVRLKEALSLGLDWHRALLANDALQDSLEHRLRNRRVEVAAAVAGAQADVERALEGLLSMLELHEHDARDHAWRVARLAGALADEIGVDRTELTEVERGALLHDIGKIDMPQSILYKPAPLDDAEWEIMRTHPRIGYDLLKRIPALADSAEVVLASHEAFNGSGYPRGLEGEDIPLASRILHIADSYDSMTRPHTQRPAMMPAHAVAEIERCSGTEYDPIVVEALGDVFIHQLEDAEAVQAH